MKGKITRINRTLFELEVGILIFGALCQFFVFLVKDKTGYSLGLWLGILVAAVSAFHMWWSLDKALELGENQAVKTMSMHNILRYMSITAVLILTAISGIVNPHFWVSWDSRHLHICTLSPKKSAHQFTERRFSLR